MFERFTEPARRVIVHAQEEARTLNHDYIGTEHLLLGITRDTDGAAAAILRSLDISLDEIRERVTESVSQGTGEEPPGQVPFTPGSKKALDLAMHEASRLGHSDIACEHLLLGLIREGEGVAARVLAGEGAELESARRIVSEMRSAAVPEQPAGSVVLDRFGRNLTQAARDGQLDPVIGRETEIARLMQVLSRRTKNNPVLVGEHGVGKGEIVTGLVQAIISGRALDALVGKQVYELDPSALTPSDTEPAKIEQSHQELLTEIRSRSDLILYFDDIHALIDEHERVAGKPALLDQILAIKGVQTIGETTPDEYRKRIESNAALEREFQQVSVDELTVANTILLLRGLRDRYESYHRVTITDDALTVAARLADRYISDRPLPGKAIDLIDEACSQLRTRRLAAPPDLRELDKRVADLRDEKEAAIEAQDFERAAQLRAGERALIDEQRDLEEKWKADGADSDWRGAVDAESVAEALAVATGLPVAEFRRSGVMVPGADHPPLWDAGQSFSLLNDLPVADATTDLLGTSGIAEGIATLLLASRSTTPLVVALDAGWGMGKSSLLRQIEGRLADERGIATVAFNAWTAHGENALEGLIKSVLGELDSNVVRRWARRLHKQRRANMIARLGFTLVGRFVGAARMVDEIWSELAIDAKSRNELRDLIREMITDWVQRDAKRGPHRSLVVFIDDLDRCSDQVVVDVCEAVKLYLDVPGLLFVIACDLSVISRGVATAARGSATEGRAYLEKIVQVAHRLPPPDEKQLIHLIRGYAARSGTSALLDETVTRILAEWSGHNPRRIKRIINSLVLEYRLNPDWGRPPLDGAQLVTAIVLQHLYPSFYDVLVDDSSGSDPIEDFLDYAAVRAKASNPPPAENAWWSAAGRTFGRRGLPTPERDPGSSDKLLVQLERLERELPEDFPVLARNQAFLALLRGVGDANQRRALRAQLVSRPLGSDTILDEFPMASARVRESTRVGSAS